MENNIEAHEEGLHEIENIEQEPEYDAVLTCMEWNTKKDKWTFPTWVPKEIYKPELVMGKARAIATSEIAHDTKIVLVTGGFQEHPETKERGSRAIELSKLIEEYGVPEEKMCP